MTDKPKRGRPKGSKNSKVCGAKKKQTGGVCGNRAGQRTEHEGYGTCYLHGGCTLQATQAAYKEMALEEARRIMGPMIDIEPHDALLLCVRIAAGEVAYCTMKINELEEPTARPETDTEKSGEEHTTEHKEGPVTTHLWIRVRQECTERLAKFSKMALDANISERSIKIAEGQGNQLAVVLQGIFSELTLSKEQMDILPEIIEKHLRMIEGSSTAALEAHVAK